MTFLASLKLVLLQFIDIYYRNTKIPNKLNKLLILVLPFSPWKFFVINLNQIFKILKQEHGGAIPDGLDRHSNISPAL